MVHVVARLSIYVWKVLVDQLTSKISFTNNTSLEDYRSVCDVAV